jgi:hypothetical protein
VLERVGNKGGDDCGMQCEDESKPCETAILFRHNLSGVVKSVGKKYTNNSTNTQINQQIHTLQATVHN